jgi:uncharacterized membrane protein YbhN (UPF0104 family)
MNRRKLLQLLLALVVTVAAGWFVLSRLSFGDLKELAKGFDRGLLALGFLMYLGTNLLRALRFRLLLEEAAATSAFFRIVVVQNFMNTFLPLRAGEISYFYMVHRMGITPGKNLGSLLAARALDFLSALIIPVAFAPFARGLAVSGQSLVWAAAFTALLIAGFVVLLGSAASLADWITAHLVSKRPLVVRGVTLLGDTLRAIGALRARRVLLRVTLLSLGGWALIYGVGYVLLTGAGLALPLADGLFAYGFPTLVSLTPVYMFGGFGLFEGSVGTGLSLVGVPLGTALAVGLLLHVAELLYIALPMLVVPMLGRSAKGRGAP